MSMGLRTPHMLPGLAGDRSTEQAAHTPGPWKTCGAQDCTCMIISCPDHPIATVESGDWGDEYPSLRINGPSMSATAEAYMEKSVYGHVAAETAKANARLIAAAPDLLAALQAIVDSLSLQDDEGLIEHAEPMIAARAAIAKATGTEPANRDA